MLGGSGRTGRQASAHPLGKLRWLEVTDVQERFDTYGAEDGGGSREKFAAFIASEQVKWARVVKEGKVQVEM